MVMSDFVKCRKTFKKPVEQKRTAGDDEITKPVSKKLRSFLEKRKTPSHRESHSKRKPSKRRNPKSRRNPPKEREPPSQREPSARIALLKRKESSSPEVNEDESSGIKKDDFPTAKRMKLSCNEANTAADELEQSHVALRILSKTMELNNVYARNMAALCKEANTAADELDQSDLALHILSGTMELDNLYARNMAALKKAAVESNMRILSEAAEMDISAATTAPDALEEVKPTIEPTTRFIVSTAVVPSLSLATTMELSNPQRKSEYVKRIMPRRRARRSQL